MKSRFLLALLSFVVAFTACKKDNNKPDQQNQDKETQLRDLTYYYSGMFSLWADKIPDSKLIAQNKNYEQVFADKPIIEPSILEKIRSAHTGNLSTGEEVLAKIKTLYANDDRFSFIDRKGVVGEEIGEGLHKEFGIIPDYFLSSANASNADLYIKLVQKNSPAEKAGIKRGMRVLSIDGDTKIDYLSQEPKDFALVNKLFGGPESIKIKVKDLNTNKESEVTLQAGEYHIEPFFENKVVTLNNKKIGYLAYTSFVEIFKRDGSHTDYYAGLENAVKSLEDQGIQELVVDLRYNGGGSTNAAELFTNLLAPTKVGTSVMYTHKVNDTFKRWRFDDPTVEGAPFAPIKFNKKNSLNLAKIYFLVTRSTASASELLINNLRPHMQVELISINDRGSYGKPVGFFGFSVMDKYADLYITSFETLNSNGQGGYFNGLIGTKKDSYDDIAHQLGDTNEQMFKDALYHIASGSYQSARASTRIGKSGESISPVSLNIPGSNSSVLGMFKFSDRKNAKL